MPCIQLSKSPARLNRMATHLVAAIPDSLNLLSHFEQRKPLFGVFNPGKGATQRYLSNEVFQAYFSRHCFLNNGFDSRAAVVCWQQPYPVH